MASFLPFFAFTATDVHPAHLKPEACADKVDDISFVRAVVADVQAKLSVDKDKLFCLGMSNGAFMTNRVACEASDLFKAFAASSGPLINGSAKTWTSDRESQI